MKEKVEIIGTATSVANGVSAQKETPYLEVTFDLEETLPGNGASGSKRFYFGSLDTEGIERARRQLGYIGIDYKLVTPDQWDDDAYLTQIVVSAAKRVRVQFEKDDKYGWQGAWINPLMKAQKGSAASILGVGATLFPQDAIVPSEPPPRAPVSAHPDPDDDVQF